MSTPKKKTQKGVYMEDRVWEAVDRKAAKLDRSINYVIEKALIEYFNLK